MLCVCGFFLHKSNKFLILRYDRKSAGTLSGALSEIQPSESFKKSEKQKLGEEFRGEPQTTQKDTVISDEDKVSVETEPGAGKCQIFYKIPHELEVEYFAVTGHEGEKKNILNEVHEKVTDNFPLFQVTLPGAPREPVPAISSDKQADIPNTLLYGEAPLYKGGKILRNEIFGNNHSIEIEIPATPDDVFEFYKAAMTAKGWARGMSMKEKERGLLFFSKGDQELVFRIIKFRQNTRVTINMVDRERFNMRQNSIMGPYTQ